MTAGTMTPLLLLAAHLVGDFVTQTNYQAAHKLTSAGARARHVCVYTVGFLPVLLLLPLTWPALALFAAILWVTHFITDSRRWASRDPWPPKQIMVDQTIHITTLAIMGLAFRL